jgi:prefoldin subunit 2
MLSECQQIAGKVQELTFDRDEHRLVVDSLAKLEPQRKAFRLIGGILTERTVGELQPIVEQHYEGIKDLINKLEDTLKGRDLERLAYKEEHGIMTEQERALAQQQQKRQIGSA